MQFARDNPNVKVVGVGAGSVSNGDTLDTAHQFVNRFGADSAGMTMIYDPSYLSWRKFGVSNQPWFMMFDDDGQLIFTHQGRVDFSTVPALFE